MLTRYEAFLAAEVADKWPAGNPDYLWVKEATLTNRNKKDYFDVAEELVNGNISLEDC